MLELIVGVWKVLKEPYKSTRSLQAQNTLDYMIIIDEFLSCRLQTSRCVSFRAPSGWSRFVARKRSRKTSNMTEIWQKLTLVQEKLLAFINNGGKLRWPRKFWLSSSRENETRTSRGVLSCVVLEINARSSSRETKSLMAASSGKWKAFHVNNI